jgi:hypothetical protein
MAYGKLIAGGVTVGILGAGAAAIVKARRDREKRRKANRPPPEPQAAGAFVEWKRYGYIGRITKGEAADDWLVEIRPAAEGAVVQLAMIEPSYALATELVRNWVDGLSGKTPKTPAVGELVVWGRTGGLHTLVVARTDVDFRWISALTSEVTANITMGPMIWGILLEAGKFIASGEAATFAEATSAANESVKAPA